MNKSKLLEAAQNHGDAAFYQGYMAALKGISISDRKTLSEMLEAVPRVEEYQKIWDALKTNNGTTYGNV